MKLFRPTLVSFVLAGLGLGAGCSSNTTKQIKAFADKICACKDAACANSVQGEYLAWWKQNQRARGGEGDRKDIEKAMQRYAECHLALVGPEQRAPAVLVPKVDLTRPAAPRVTGGDSPVEEPAQEVNENEATSEAPSKPGAPVPENP